MCPDNDCEATGVGFVFFFFLYFFLLLQMKTRSKRKHVLVLWIIFLEVRSNTGQAGADYGVLNLYIRSADDFFFQDCLLCLKDWVGFLRTSFGFLEICLRFPEDWLWFIPRRFWARVEIHPLHLVLGLNWAPPGGIKKNWLRFSCRLTKALKTRLFLTVPNGTFVILIGRSIPLIFHPTLSTKTCCGVFSAAALF